MFAKVFCLIAVIGIAAASLPVIQEPLYHHAPKPYKFRYDIKVKHGEQYRQEEGNSGHAVKGSYGFTDARGVKRQVNYVADHAGFRAQVKTNEPGTANQNPAAVLMVSDAPYAGGMALGGLGLGRAAVGGYGVGNVDLGFGGLGLGAATFGGYGVGNVDLGFGGLGLGATTFGGYGVGNVGQGYGVVAPGYVDSAGQGGLGYSIGSIGGLGYARYGY